MKQVALLSDFADSPFKIIKGTDRPILLIKEDGKIHAVDNRCPHMGFPLNKGTVNNGILTCHWHHARFDAGSGCAFDLFADDIPSYDVKVEGNVVFLSKAPRNKPTASYFRNRLHQGLEQNISIIIYKSIIGLLQSKVSHLEIVREITEFGSSNHENWSSGMTLLAITINLWPELQENTRIGALCKAAQQVAMDCDRQPSRRKFHMLEGSDFDSQQLIGWFRDWVRTRHREGAERTLLTQLEHGDDISLSDMVFGALHDRVYSNAGHNVDFANKAIELSLSLEGESASQVLPLMTVALTEARGEEENSAWSHPIDLIPIIRESEKNLESIWKSDAQFLEASFSMLRDLLQGENPQAIVDEIINLCRQKADPKGIAREIAYVAALRLAQFPESNDIADWFAPVHTFNFANAVCQSIVRHNSLQSGRGLFHAALSVFQDRYLNIPNVSLPNPDEELVGSYRNNSNWHRDLLDTLNEKRSWRIFPEQVVAVYRAGRGLAELIDMLSAATLREDFDFHKLQCVDAGAAQAKLWKGQEEAEHILAGVARHLTSHAPTPRGQSKMINIAKRLQRGEKLYEDDSIEKV
jgi:nitrite reductase/ring-hydroxylating ferredoxin subunit